MKKEEATPLAWLEWFWDNCDFGPAHEDVIHIMEQRFEKETRQKVPKEYSIHCEDEYEEC